MKTYTHPKWYIAKYKLTNYLWDLYEIDNWTRKFHHLVTEQELLDFWFIEDKQEELNTHKIQQAYNEFMRLVNDDKQKVLSEERSFKIDESSRYMSWSYRIGLKFKDKLNSKEYKHQSNIWFSKESIDKWLEVMKQLNEEDKQEDWKQELSKDIIKLINTCIENKLRLIEEKDLEAVTRSIISLIDNRHNSN